MTDEGKIILFRNTHDAIRAEETLINKGLRPRVIPVPKHISSDCGIALLLSMSCFEEAIALLEDAGVFIAGRVNQSEVKGI